MLQLDEPEDFVIATGEVHSVREFVEAAFGQVSKISLMQSDEQALCELRLKERALYKNVLLL